MSQIKKEILYKWENQVFIKSPIQAIMSQIHESNKKANFVMTTTVTCSGRVWNINNKFNFFREMQNGKGDQIESIYVVIFVKFRYLKLVLSF